MEFEERHKNYREQVEAALDEALPACGERPSRLHAAMRYSLEAGGKRLRPTLVLASCDAFSGEAKGALAAAVAVECIHTYSLIHDDLPCMDDAQLRRGRPTCHARFDEATALLAGDALLTFAFEHLASAYTGEPVVAVGLMGDLARASGSRHLIGGQMEDLASERGLGEGPADARECLAFIHRNKTARLIQACVEMGARLAGNGMPARVSAFGAELGLAFQVVDDILDETSETAVLGKTAGIDARNETLTYTSVHGLAAARRQVRAHTERALCLLEELRIRDPFLAELTRALEHRAS